MTTPATRRARLGWPARLADTVGMTVQTRRDLENGYMIIPAGTICTVHQTTGHGWNGMTIAVDPDPRFHVRPTMGRVPWSDLSPVDRDALMTAAVHSIEYRAQYLNDGTGGEWKDMPPFTSRHYWRDTFNLDLAAEWAIPTTLAEAEAVIKDRVAKWVPGTQMRIVTITVAADPSANVFSAPDQPEHPGEAAVVASRS